MEKIMTKEAAFEMDDFLTIMNAGVSTLLTIHEHFCGEPGPISEGRAQELNNALWSICMYLQAVVNGERRKVNEAFAEARTEREAGA